MYKIKITRNDNKKFNVETWKGQGPKNTNYFIVNKNFLTIEEAKKCIAYLTEVNKQVYKYEIIKK